MSRPLESSEKQTEATAEKVVDALQDAYGLHPGQCRNHTKGVGALGTFVDIGNAIRSGWQLQDQLRPSGYGRRDRTD